MLKNLIGKAKGANPRRLYSKERHLVNQSFFYEGTNGKGVLLVHGWTSTPYELRRLGIYLNENGYTVYGVLLSGHGSAPKDLDGMSWRVWSEDVKLGYEKLKETCKDVFVIGTSIGANMAVMLGAKQKDVAGLIMMAMPHKIRAEFFLRILVKTLILCGMTYKGKVYPPTFGSSKTITRGISYQIYPLVSVLEVFSAVRETRRVISEIQQPCLVLQSTHDHIVVRKNLENIFNGISSKIKKKKYIKKAYHTFISDIENEHVFQDILEFLDEN